MTYFFILFNDTVNITTSSQLWLSCGAVSLKFRIAWKLLSDCSSRSFLSLAVVTLT